jgi:hypothetical protein
MSDKAACRKADRAKLIKAHESALTLVEQLAYRQEGPGEDSRASRNAAKRAADRAELAVISAREGLLHWDRNLCWVAETKYEDAVSLLTEAKAYAVRINPRRAAQLPPLPEPERHTEPLWRRHQQQEEWLRKRQGGR